MLHSLNTVFKGFLAFYKIKNKELDKFLLITFHTVVFSLFYRSSGLSAMPMKFFPILPCLRAVFNPFYVDCPFFRSGCILLFHTVICCPARSRYPLSYPPRLLWTLLQNAPHRILRTAPAGMPL